MADHTHPRISASLSLDPRTYSLSSSQVSKLSLTVLLEYDQPITIYDEDLSPSLMLKYCAFTIRHREFHAEVKQIMRTRCKFIPPSKVQVTLDDRRFHALYPGQALALTSPFAPRISEVVTQEANDLEVLCDGWVIVVSYGDGELEPGHEYVLDLVDQPRLHWRRIRWWEYGTKDSILYPTEAANALNARKVNTVVDRMTRSKSTHHAFNLLNSGA